MKRIVILLLPFILISCNGFGSKKVKNIVELTPKLSVQINEPVQIDPSIKINLFDPSTLKSKEYPIAKHQIVAEPIFVDGVVYAIDIRGNVYAFSKKDKTVIWSYNVSTNKDDNYIGGGILHHNGKLYITYGSRSLAILDAASGHEIIRKEFPDIIRIKPVKLNDNIILVQTISNQLFALNVLRLDFVWQHEGLTATLSSSYYVNPIVHNNHVIVNYNSGQIFALNAATGEALWTVDLSNPQEIGLPNFESATMLCMPIVQGSNLYIASGSGKLIKLNIETGFTIWQIDANDILSMSLVGNSLFITNNAQQVAAISTESGKVKFVADLYINQDIKKIKATAFLPPLISKTNTGWNLNVITKNGTLYSFQSDNKGNFIIPPSVTKIVKNIGYYGTTCCGTMYFTTDKKIIFSEVAK